MSRDFIGHFTPPALQEKPTPEQIAEKKAVLVQREKYKQRYQRTKENGSYQRYYNKTKERKKEKINEAKEAERAKDREKGIYFEQGVPDIPRAEKKVKKTQQLPYDVQSEVSR